MIQDIVNSLKDYVAICNAMCYLPCLVENEQLQACTYYILYVKYTCTCTWVHAGVHAGLGALL